jgi:Spy/CpxP family protein refolding chaperone
MLKTRRSALFSLILVFLSGSLIGALSYRLYSVSTVAEPASRIGSPPPREDPEVVRKRIVSDMQQRLTLDEKQVVQLNAIYDDTRRQFDELHQKANSETRALWDEQTNRIRAILRPDQLTKYEELRRQREEERKKRKREQKGAPPPSPPGSK